MPINLSKGQKVDLTKGNPGLTKIMVGLGWDVNAFDSGSAFDLDAAAFLLGASGKCPTERDFIFYGNLKHSTGAVEHMGDNLTGEGDGDDEQIMVDLAKVPASIERIAFTCTIYDAENRRQNFGQVSNAFIRIVDQSTGTELIRYDLAEDFSIETAIVVGCTATTASGNSMPSAAASRAVWQPCAATTALTLSDYKEEYHAYQFTKRTESQPDQGESRPDQGGRGPGLGREQL